MISVQDFPYETYIEQQLAKDLVFCWLLENVSELSNNEGNFGDRTFEIGFLLGRYHDESPPPNLSQNLLDRHRINHPYQYRRVASVLALYVEPKHRNPEAIGLLVDAALQHAESMKVTDIDLMVGAQLSGLQSLLERLGFTRTAVQYTRHYNLPDGIELPNLHPSIPELEDFEPPAPRAIPLRDPKTGELIKSPQGNPVFLQPLENLPGGKASQTPVYATPVRDPQTQSFVFDPQDQLVVCPILRNKEGEVFTHKGLPQFQPPAYECISGKLQLKQDGNGNYLFCDAERNDLGEILCNQQGEPLFENPLYQSK